MDDVYASLEKWQAVKYDTLYLQEIFSKGNMFSFIVMADFLPAKNESDAYIHAYPGVLEDKLYFQLISLFHDKNEKFEVGDPPEFVKTCKVEERDVNESAGNSLEMIPKPVALARINSWNNDKIRNEWLKGQTEYKTMYEGFVIPAGDIIPGDLHEVYFALQTDDTETGDKDAIADLIVINKTKGKTIYKDIVRPVPPFKPYYNEADFGLLNFVKNE